MLGLPSILREPLALAAGTLDLYAAPGTAASSCGQASPCGLQDALDEAATANPGAPVKILLENGVYSGAFVWADSAASAPTTLTLAGPASLPGATLDAGGSGAGLTVDAPSGTTVVDDLTLTGGSAASGGAIEVSAGSLHVESSTLFGNEASVSGGALDVAAGSALLEGSSVVGNDAPADGAIAAAAGAAVTLHADVLADNGAAPACSSSAVTDDGYDVADDASCLGSSASSTSVSGPAATLDAELFGAAPALVPAGEAGGVVPLIGDAGDPAYDDVSSSVGALAAASSFCSQRDERGAARLQAGASGCDSGSMQFAPPVVSSLSPTSGGPGTTVTVSGNGFLFDPVVSLGSAVVSPHVSSNQSMSFSVPAIAGGPASLTVNNPDGSSTLQSAFDVLTPLQVATTSLPTAEVGVAYSTALQASGGSPPYTWNIVGNPPSGLALSSGGALSGRPADAGTMAVVVSVADADHAHAGASIALVVVAAPAVATTSLPSAELGHPYSVSLSASGGTPPYSWSIQSGAVPGGLLLDSDGMLTGIPGMLGPAAIDVRVSDSLGSSGSASLALTVLGSAPAAQRYVVLDANGGLTESSGDTLRAGGGRLDPVVGIAAAPRGWWVARRSGRVVGVGGARTLGSLPRNPGSPVAGIAAVAGGYYIVTSAGAVYGFGSARAAGSLDLTGTQRRVVGIAAPRRGRGYWLLESNGVVAAFGSARSLGSPPLHERIGRWVGIAVDAAGSGYWVATGSGRVLDFGTAAGEGSLSSQPHAGSVTGIAAAPRGSGYWLVTSVGDVYAFGTARLASALVGTPASLTSGPAGTLGSAAPTTSPPAGQPAGNAVAIAAAG